MTVEQAGAPYSPHCLTIVEQGGAPFSPHCLIIVTAEAEIVTVDAEREMVTGLQGVGYPSPPPAIVLVTVKVVRAPHDVEVELVVL